jgi:hypothetical protein
LSFLQSRHIGSFELRKKKKPPQTIWNGFFGCDYLEGPNLPGASANFPPAKSEPDNSRAPKSRIAMTWSSSKINNLTHLTNLTI